MYLYFSFVLYFCILYMHLSVFSAYVANKRLHLLSRGKMMHDTHDIDMGFWLSLRLSVH